MTPRMPMARARVSVSASIRVPTTRIVPARPTSRPPGRRPPLPPDGQAELAAGGAAEGDDAADPWPVARSVMDVPGWTSRTMPATGASSGSGTSPVASRHLPRHVNSSSPPSSVWRTPAGPAPPSRDQRAPGSGSADDAIETSSSRASRSRSAIGAPTTTDSPDLDQRAVARGEREDRIDRRLDQPAQPAPCSEVRGPPAGAGHAGPPGRTAACQARSCSRRPSARSGRRSGTSRRSTRRPAEAAGDLDGEAAPAAAEPDRVAEPEVGDGSGPGSSASEVRSPDGQVAASAPDRRRGR